LPHKDIDEANHFLGFVQEENQEIYEKIQSAGFVLMFREHSGAMMGKKKGD
jgi:hypothetical protein